jgi:uncharacterized membrane protein YdjX (TVP38/TMEM64 family)
VLDIDITTLLAWRDTLAQTWALTPAWCTVCYVALYVLLTALCLPGASVLMLVGAGLMDFTLCLLLSNAACTLGAWLTALGSRYGLHDRFGHARWLQAVKHRLSSHEIAFLISIRLAPVIPFAVFNVLAGLICIHPWRFLWTSFVGTLPGTWLYVNAGAQLWQIRSLEEVLKPSLFASIAALAVIPWILEWMLRSRTCKIPFNP